MPLKRKHEMEADMSKPSEARWRAVAYYKTENGLVDVEHWLDELADLHDRIEAGPHWDTIDRIEVFRVNHNESERLTVEAAAAL